MKIILHLFFKLLYHQFAFAYDLVSAAVSLGHWKDWVSSILPFLRGTRILEIGSGPGHLQRLILARGLTSVAIDESTPMLRLAKRNIRRNHSGNNKASSEIQTHRTAYAHINLTRGLAQQLPFRDQAFDTIVATFPAKFITKPETLSEARRCLSDGGRFIVLPVALQRGRGMLERAMSLLFRITHQSPVDPIEEVKKKLSEPFIETGFEVDVKELQVKSSLLLVILASK